MSKQGTYEATEVSPGSHTVQLVGYISRHRGRSNVFPTPALGLVARGASIFKAPLHRPRLAVKIEIRHGSMPAFPSRFVVSSRLKESQNNPLTPTPQSRQRPFPA